jgi:hypothetical protein
MRRLPQRQRAPREIVAAIIGAEAGIGVGLLAVGGTPLAPLAFGVLGAGIAAGAVYARNTLVRRWLRAQLRGPRGASAS